MSGITHRPTRGRHIPAVWRASGPAFGLARGLALGLAFCLGGCVETLPQVAADAPAQAPALRIVARPGVSPAGASVAFTSLDGPPAHVASRFNTAMSSALAGRDVSTSPSASANYLIQGHLGVWPGEKGVTIAWVWDVFDTHKQRLRRMEDQILAAQTSDPWSAATDAVLASVAARSADELAAFLSNTPEALVATGRGAAFGVQSATKAPAAPTLGYTATH